MGKEVYKSLTFLLIFPSLAYSETTIGRWCDRMLPNLPEFNRTMTLVVTDNGKVELRSNFKGGVSFPI